MGFGRTNATATKIYRATSQTKDDYGSPVWATYTASTWRVWFEKSVSYNRSSNGDSAFSKNRIIAPFNQYISEGDMIEIQLDSANGITETAKKWRIENINSFYGFQRNDKRIDRMEIDLIEEK